MELIKVINVGQGMENLSQSVPKDELQDDPRQDILARALNVPEYPGRVRAAGLGVCQKRYFSGKKRRRMNPTVEEMDDLKAQLQQMKTMMCEMSKKLNDKEAMDKQQSDLVVASVKDSASYHIPKGTSPCDLKLSTPTHRVVGKGQVFNVEGATLHNKPLPLNHIKVLMEIAVEPNANLPVPDDYEGNTKVGQAIGTFLAWPINLIGLCNTKPTHDKGKADLPTHTSESISTPKKKKKIDSKKPSPAKNSLFVMPRKKPGVSKIQKPFPAQKSTVVASNKKQGQVNNQRPPCAEALPRSW
ncbi:uncharacterized protein LOC130710657 [Lotus japonicus]|uniref:uncharacterized protein LOC130710657 n=1 Tax=Lotus japonicus TaxID=34305 RepID=UPI002589A54E|nr:uncharacterized protein LOC130710657 [Lotus japonicus]XP_057415979.1 uncharacterized protein LOC130710657 [Lotus japonicus]XP_057415980.1 uncharacterized protein LOC130710657 [Lotus japonicus]